VNAISTSEKINV